MLRKFLASQGAITFPWRDGITISVLKNPKPALVSLENKEVVDSIINDLGVIATESFGAKLDEQTNDGVRNHVIEVDSLGFIHKQNKLLGFASSKLFHEDRLFYLHGVAIATEFKGRGGGTILVKKLAEIAGFPRIAFTTQNPIMFCLLKKLCRKVYPRPGVEEIPQELKKLGCKIIDGRSDGLNPEKLVVNQLYGRCLYNQIPDCTDLIVKQWFTESLEIEGGLTRNAFLFIGDRK